MAHSCFPERKGAVPAVTDELTEIAIWAAAAFLIGGIAGAIMQRWAERLTPLNQPAASKPHLGDHPWPVAILSGLLTAALVVAMLYFHCEATPMVRPDPIWRYGRAIYHSLLLWWLIAMTITDLRDYVIPDEITLSGTVIGVLGATASGDLQMMHIWIDWNAEVPGLRGPDFPAWIAEHHHLHGLAWSLAGLAVGAGLTWIVRFLSAAILGRQALGFGDVTLMAMIGSFLGWQPTVCVFLLAPLCGMLLALVSWISTGRNFVPYGPYLGVATLGVLFTWRWIWEPLKWTFGDWQSLAILGSAGLGALLILLAVLRFYWSIPIEKTERDSQPQENPADPKNQNRP